MDLKSRVYMFNNVGVVGELEVADPNIQDNEIAEFGRFITVYQVSLQFTTARVQRLNESSLHHGLMVGLMRNADVELGHYRLRSD